MSNRNTAAAARHAAAARTAAPMFEALENRQLQSASAPTVAGYLPDYSASAATIAKLDYSTLNTINYFSVNPDSTGYIPGTNGEAATSAGGASLTRLKDAVTAAHGHNLKINIVIGGAGQNLAFENFMGDATKRDTFAKSVKTFCSRYGLDGVDLDYEAPGERGISLQQIADYSKVIAAVDAAAPSLHLSAAVAPDKVALATPVLGQDGKQLADADGKLQWSTDWSEAKKNWVLDDAAITHLDEIGVMAYDYSPGAGNADQTHALASMNAWADHAAAVGGSRQQILLGLPFYGRSGPSSWEQSGPSGAATYNDILRGRAGGVLPDASATSTVATVADTGWPHTLDNKSVTWFYDNPATIQAKTTAAVNAHVGGVMIWDVTQDYFTDAGKADDVHSLMPAVKRGLAAGAAAAPTTPTAPPAPVDSRTARILGRVFFDGDRNGQFDGYNSGNEGRTVFLDANNNGVIDAGEKTAETDADGNYAFELLPAGTYNVRLEAKSYYFSTTPIAKQVTLAVDEDVFNVDFGEWVTYRSGR